MDWLSTYTMELGLVDQWKLFPSGRLPQVLVFDNSDYQLKSDQINLLLDGSNPIYIIPTILQDFTAQLLNLHLDQNPHLFNGSTIRLNFLEWASDRSLNLRVSKASYYDYLSTNLSMDVKLAQKKKTLRAEIHRDGMLPALPHALLANHLGVSVLLITQDHQLVLQKRSTDTIHWRPNEWAPSISGGSDALDIGKSLNHLVYREAEEELSILPEDFEALQFLGITRELERGGKPELFFWARIKLDFNTLKRRQQKAVDHWENQLLAAHPLDQLQKCLAQVQATGGILSIPLLTNLNLWGMPSNKLGREQD